jgi:hypothetical protein
MDGDMMAAMGFAGFGKTKSARTLDPKRFEKTRREVNRSVSLASPRPGELMRACRRRQA